MRNHTSFATALLAIVLATGACSNKREAEQNVSASVAVVKGVVLETAKSVAVPEMLEVVGTVRARNSAVVSARVPGSINLLRVHEGDRVQKGQLLIQLDAQENQAVAAAATAAIDDARRALDEAFSRKKLADATFERYHNLFNEQAVSRQEFDSRQADKDLAGQSVARAEAHLRQAQEGARGAATLAGYTRITSPISGIITAKQAELGASVFPAQPLMTIEDEGDYLLELVIPESMAAKVKPGSVVQVTLDATNSAFAAKISEIVPAADPVSRTFTAKVKLSQKGLKSGMFGRGSINTGTSFIGMFVSKKAVMERGALTSVWVLDKNNIARNRLVKAGKTLGEKVEILSGLSDGERVVSAGVEKVSEGAKVE